MAVRNFLISILFASLLFVPHVSAEDLIQRIPAGANAIMLIDVSALASAPMARTQGWANKLEQAAVERPLILLPEASQLIVGSQLNFAKHLDIEWQVAAMSLKEPLLMRSIARAEAGYLDKIGEFDCVHVPSDAYFVALKPQQLGIVYPANRQFVSRWTQNALGTMSSRYLTTAAKLLNRSTQIVCAADLKDVFQPHRVRAHVETSAVLKTLSAKSQAIDVILGMKGATLEIEVGQTAQGTLTVDFNDSPEVFGTQTKPVLLEAFDLLGIQLPGLDAWTVKIVSNSIVVKGTLSTDALRRVFSLLELPSASFSTENEGSDSTSATPAKTADKKTGASLAYFKQVSVLIDDLRKTLDNTKDNHAVIMERYARKVDAFLVLNVDDDLLVWGARVGETLRVMALARRGNNLQSGARKSSFYANNYSMQTITSIDGQISAEANAQATAIRYNNWNAMEDATAAIRKEMTKRYQVEF